LKSTETGECLSVLRMRTAISAISAR